MRTPHRAPDRAYRATLPEPLRLFLSRLAAWLLGVAAFVVLAWVCSWTVLALPAASTVTVGVGATRRDATVSVVLLAGNPAAGGDRGAAGAASASPTGGAGGDLATHSGPAQSEPPRSEPARSEHMESVAVRSAARDAGDILANAEPPQQRSGPAEMPQRESSAEPGTAPPAQHVDAGAAGPVAEAGGDDPPAPPSAKPGRNWVQRNVTDKVSGAVGSARNWWQQRQRTLHESAEQYRRMTPEQRQAEYQRAVDNGQVNEMGVATPLGAAAKLAAKYGPQAVRAIGKHAPRVASKTWAGTKSAAATVGRAAQAGGAAVRDRVLVPVAGAARSAATTVGRSVRADLQSEINAVGRGARAVRQAIADPRAATRSVGQAVTGKLGGVRDGLRHPIQAIRAKGVEAVDRIGTTVRSIRNDPVAALKRWPSYARQRFTKFATRALAVEGARRGIDEVAGSSEPAGGTANGASLYVGPGGGQTRTEFTDASGRRMEAVTTEGGFGHSVSATRAIGGTPPPEGDGLKASGTVHWGGTGGNLEAFRNGDGSMQLTGRLQFKGFRGVGASLSCGSWRPTSCSLDFVRPSEFEQEFAQTPPSGSGPSVTYRIAGTHTVHRPRQAPSQPPDQTPDQTAVLAAPPARPGTTADIAAPPPGERTEQPDPGPGAPTDTLADTPADTAAQSGEPAGAAASPATPAPGRRPAARPVPPPLTTPDPPASPPDSPRVSPPAPARVSPPAAGSAGHVVQRRHPGVIVPAAQPDDQVPTHREPVRQPFAPLHDHRRLRDIGVQVEVVQLGGAGEPVRVNVHHRHAAPPGFWCMLAGDDERRRGDRAGDPESTSDPAREDRLSCAEWARKQNEVTGAEASPDPGTECLGVRWRDQLDVGVEGQPT